MVASADLWVDQERNVSWLGNTMDDNRDYRSQVAFQHLVSCGTRLTSALAVAEMECGRRGEEKRGLLDDHTYSPYLRQAQCDRHMAGSSHAIGLKSARQLSEPHQSFARDILERFAKLPRVGNNPLASGIRHL